MIQASFQHGLAKGGHQGVFPYKIRIDSCIRRTLAEANSDWRYLKLCLTPNYVPFHCRQDRLKAASSMYVLQNGAVAVSALSALVSLKSSQGSAMFWTGAVCTIASGSFSSVGSQGSTLSVEKEWTTVLCRGDSAALAKINSGSYPADNLAFLVCIATGKSLLMPSTACAACSVLNSSSQQA